MARKLYPLGIQTFERIRKEDKLYIDKTEYVYHMTHTCHPKHASHHQYGSSHQQMLFVIFSLLTDY